MSKLSVAKVVAKLSVMGYDLITSKYELVSANGKTLNNHKLSYILKDTQDKTGRLTFIDGRKSFKNGLAIDISIANDYDLQRPLKVQNRGEFINLLTIDYEEEDIILAKVENQYKKDSNIQNNSVDNYSVDNYSVQYNSVDNYSNKLEEIQDSINYINKSLISLEVMRKNINDSTKITNSNINNIRDDLCLLRQEQIRIFKIMLLLSIGFSLLLITLILLVH